MFGFKGRGAGGGNPFPGYGGAPPAVGPASDAGVSPLASRADHTHRAFFNLKTSGSATIAAGDNIDTAPWAPAADKWYFATAIVDAAGNFGSEIAMDTLAASAGLSVQIIGQGDGTYTVHLDNGTDNEVTCRWALWELG